MRECLKFIGDAAKISHSKQHSLMKPKFSHTCKVKCPLLIFFHFIHFTYYNLQKVSSVVSNWLLSPKQSQNCLQIEYMTINSRLKLLCLLLVVTFSSDRFIVSLLQCAQLVECSWLFLFQWIKLSTVLLIHLVCLMSCLHQLPYQLFLISAHLHSSVNPCKYTSNYIWEQEIS